MSVGFVPKKVLHTVHRSYMPTTRKPAAKKPTTRAAAAKKTTTRKPAAKRVEPTTEDLVEIVTTPLNELEEYTSNPVPYTEEQRQAKLEAYHALKSVGLDVPAELATEVEGWIAELMVQREAEERVLAAERAKIVEVNQAGPWYVRNGYPAPFNLRLDRQTEKRRIELKPRGTPGDLHPLKDEDLKDPVLKQNLTLGLIEIIPAGEAALIIEKQTTNMSQRVHTPLALLRNEYDKMYQQGAVKVEAEYNSQGITVAAVDPRVASGQLHDREIGGTRATGGITRVQPGQGVPDQGQLGPQQATSVVHSGFVPTGGNPAIVQYGPMGDNARAKAVDDLARRKGPQGPGAGLGNVTVTVDPVRRT